MTATRQDYIAAALARGTEPTEFETQTLSAGREFLPPAAIAVLEGAEPTSEYWAILVSQLG
ncbi:MAG: hypothetical protein ABW217_03940 [Polyangiaceae bacterium]